MTRSDDSNGIGLSSSVESRIEEWYVDFLIGTRGWLSLLASWTTRGIRGLSMGDLIAVKFRGPALRIHRWIMCKHGSILSSGRILVCIQSIGLRKAVCGSFSAHVGRHTRVFLGCG